MTIKLSNGLEINLKDLDKLENKEAKGFGSYFDSLKAGGIQNAIFDKVEIEKIKEFLSEIAGDDGIIDESEMSTIPLKYKSIFEGYNEKNLSNDLSMLALSISPSNLAPEEDELITPNTVEPQAFTSPRDNPISNKDNVLPHDANNQKNISQRYKVKHGDTLAKIVASLGYKGQNARIYLAEFQKQLTEDGSFMNNKNWLMAGSTIRLLSEEKLEQLGIPSPKTNSTPQPSIVAKPNGNTTNNAPTRSDNVTTPTKPKEKNIGTTTQPTPSTENEYRDEGALLSTQTTPKNTSNGPIMVKVTPNTILQKIKDNKQKGSIINESLLDDKQKKLYSEAKFLYQIEPVLIKNNSTGEVHIFIDASKSPRIQKQKMSAIEIVTGKTDEIKTTRYYQNGKIAIDYEYSDSSKNYSKLVQKPNIKEKPKKKLYTPVPIKIKADPSVYANASAGQKKDIDKFLKTLEDKKESLMKDLHIDSEEYNHLAQLACCVAMQETQFGTCSSYKYWDDTVAGIALKDTGAVINIGLNKIGIKNPIKNETAVSKGFTQIKIGDWDDNPRIAKLFEKYGITKGYYNSLSPEQSAAATIIILKECANQVKDEKFQNGIEAAKGKYYHVNRYLKDGVGVDGSRYIYNDVTEDDAIMYLYNGSPGAVANGKMTPDIRPYTHNIRRYKNLFKIKENEQVKQYAQEHAVTEQPRKTNISMSQDLGYGIGHVAFMPKLYKGGISQNNENEIKQLSASLLAKGYNPTTTSRLINKLKNGELSFAYGLTEKEISAMTENDINLLLKYSDSLNQKLKTVNGEAAKRKMAISVEREFKQKYLASHAKQVNYSSVAKSSVILNNRAHARIKQTPTNGYNTGAQKRCKKYLSQLRGSHKADSGLYAYDNRVKNGLYTGFNVVRDNGINYSNASNIDILLAQNATDVANTLRTSGGCLTGAKQSLIGSGAVTAEEVRNFNNAFQLAKFMEKYPNRFKEIKYVQISPTVSREITAADIASLPAGCIVVYGNAKRTDVPGHAGITNGNGQIAADEFDNSYWDNFAAKDGKQNGKGEHGYVRVFMLNPDYYQFDASTKSLKKK